MNKFEELHQTIRRNIHVVGTWMSFADSSLLMLVGFTYQFQEDPGPALMLLLYSSILTRGIDQ